ncbi:MAG: hypothetical protein L0Y80_09620 [Ignavibacteriae bacterium]|nr:hypothetical protein [Ignavibacteriota bacterium]
MARDVHKPAAKRGSGKDRLPFTKTNYQILAVALLVIAAGYVALAQAPWDGFLPLVVAPILLVTGYCILVPFGILYRSKKERDVNGASSESDSTPSNAAAS